MIVGGLSLAFVLIAAATLAALWGSSIGIIRDPRKSSKTLAAIGVMLLIFIIGWGASSSEVTTHMKQYNIGSVTSKLIEGGLVTMVFLIASATLALGYSEVSKLFRK